MTDFDTEATPRAAVRPMERADLPALAIALQETDLFPADLLEGMAEPWFNDPDLALWLVADDGQGFAHALPEALTEGTWNLLALAVRPSAQGRGRGAALVRGVLTDLARRGARLIIIDTAGTEDYAPARRLYARLGFVEVARMPEFWAAGVDKVTFALRL